MSEKLMGLLILGVTLLGLTAFSEQVCKMKTLSEKNARVKEVNHNIDQGLKTTNRILDVFVKPSP